MCCAPTKMVSKKNRRFLSYFRASVFRLSMIGRPAGLVAFFLITWKVFADQRMPRNSTHRLIELRKRRTQLIIFKCTIMGVDKMAHISKRLAPFLLVDGAPDNSAPPAHMFRGGFDWPRTSNPNKISLP